jgi:hypothetical protein
LTPASQKLYRDARIHAINGHDIIEFDYFTGMECACADYRTPTALWERYRAGSGTPAWRVVCSYSYAFKPAKAALRSQSNAANLLSCAVGDGAMGWRM